MENIVLIRPNVVTVLQLLIKESYTSIEISDKTGIPIASCYRIIKELKNSGLIKSEYRRFEGNAYSNVYRSTKDKYHLKITDATIIGL